MTRDYPEMSAGLTRRSLIKATGTTTAGVLFGSSTAGSEPTPLDQSATFRTVTRTSPREVQFNPRNDRDRAENVEALLFEPLAEYDATTGTFVPVLAKTWTFSGDAAEITLRQGYSWHEVSTETGTVGGQSIDAADLERELLIDEKMNADYWDVVSSVSVTDTHTVRVEFDREVNQSVLSFDLLQRRLSHPPTYFEGSAGDLSSLAIRPADGDPPVGSGPFKFDSLDEETLTLTAASEYPQADAVGIDAFVFADHNSESEQWAALVDEEISGNSRAFYPEPFRQNEGATPIETLEQLEAPSEGGWAILINHHHPLLSDRRVRKAIAHIFSSAEAVDSLTDTVPETISVLTGLSPETTREYLDDELGRFETYGDRKRAAELLGHAGFDRTWEQWLDPRGEPVTFGFLPGANPHADDSESFAPAEPGWFYGARAFVDQLQDFLRHDDDSIPSFGADATPGLRGVGPHDDMFAFVPARQWGHFDGAHPYHTFRSDLLLRESVTLGYGPTVEVPPYDDPSGTPQTVDLEEKVDALRTATNDAEERRLVRDLAWIVNETVPYLQGYYRPSTGYVDERFWSVGETGVAPQTPQLTRTGNLHPK